jgi:arylsulfatase
MFLEQRAEGFDVWREPFVQLRTPYLFNLRTDPLERAIHEAMDFQHWFFDHIFLLTPAQAIVQQFMSTFAEFPPRQKPASFSIEQADAKLADATTSGR